MSNPELVGDIAEDMAIANRRACRFMTGPLGWSGQNSCQERVQQGQ